MTDHETRLQDIKDELEFTDGLDIHTNGGGMHNNITVIVEPMARFPRENTEVFENYGYRVSSVIAGDARWEDRSDTVLCMEYVGDGNE